MNDIINKLPKMIMGEDINKYINRRRKANNKLSLLQRFYSIRNSSAKMIDKEVELPTTLRRLSYCFAPNSRAIRMPKPWVTP